jgi:hypothetical protein
MNAVKLCKKMWKEVEKWMDRVQPPPVLVGVGAWGAYMSCLALGLSEEIARLIPRKVRKAIQALDP